MTVLWRGSVRDYKHSEFVKTCKGKTPTLMCARTKRGKVFGGFTDIPWDVTDNYAKHKGNTFVFKFDNEKLTTFEHRGGKVEVWHSRRNIFRLGDGPWIREDGTADATLSWSFEAIHGCERGIVLCKEKIPKLEDVEIF